MSLSPMVPSARHNPDLAARFAARKCEVLGALEQFGSCDGEDEDSIASLERGLHRLAGVAALFGAARLGTLAAEAVEELRLPRGRRSDERFSPLRAAILVEGRC